MFNINKQLVDSNLKKVAELDLDIFKDNKGSRYSEEKILSLSFLVYGVASFFEIEIEEAQTYITDGGNDGGFDAGYFETDENVLNVFLFQSKYKRDLENDSNFPANSIEKSINTIKTIFDPNKKIELNPFSKSFVDEIRDNINNGLIPKIHFIMLFNGNTWQDSANDMITNNFGNSDQVNFMLYNHDDIINKSSYQEKVNATLSLQGKALKDDYNYKSVIIGKIPVTEIHSLIDRHKDKLLEKNVRKYLGNTSVNEQISKTLLNEDDNTNFFFYNNGITFTCDKMTANYLQENDWKINVENLQIINGGQTCRTIYETISTNPNVNYLYSNVLVRIYEIDGNESLLSEIAFATNNQNAIDLKDLKSNDVYQMNLEQGSKNLGYTFRRKRDLTLSNSGSNIIPIQVSAESVFTVWRRQPSLAKSKKGELFSTYYTEVFEELNAAQMITAVKIFRFSDSMRKRYNEDQDINIARKFSNYFIAMIMGDLLLKHFKIELKDLTHNNFYEIESWLEANLDVLHEEAESISVELLRKQLNTIMEEEDLPFSRIDGRTISSVFRSGILKNMHDSRNINID